MLIKLNDLIVQHTEIIKAEKIGTTWEVEVKGKTPLSHYWCRLSGDNAVAFENKTNELCK